MKNLENKRDSNSSCQSISWLSLSVNFGPQGTILLRPLGIDWSFFAGQVRASEDHLAPAVKDSLVFLCMPMCGLRRPSGPSCQELSGLFVCQFWALRDHLAPTVGNCLIILYLSISILIRPLKILRGLIMPFKILRGLLGP